MPFTAMKIAVLFGEQIRWLLRADGRTVASPVGATYPALVGTLVTVQNDGSIAADGTGFQVTAQTTPAWPDLSAAEQDGLTRVAGLATAGRIVVDDVTKLLIAGWYNDAVIDDGGAQGIYTAASLLQVVETDGTIINISIPIADGDIIDYMAIARATGSHILVSINGGVWQRIWTFNTDSTATLYAGMSFYSAAPAFKLRATQLNGGMIPGVIVSDNFGDGSAPFVTDGEGHLEADGRGAGYTWVGGWSNNSNQSSNDATGGAELLVDGDMEAAGVGAWAAGNNATLTKETAAPYEGLQSLRIARNGVNNPLAFQTVQTVDEFVHISGRAKSDGNALPKVVETGGLPIWTGTTSTLWQAFDFYVRANGTNFFLQTLSATGTEYTEWDDVSVVELLIADMLRLVDTGSAHHEAWLDLTIAADTFGGVCVACDDADNPQDFVIVYFDRVENKVHADKYIAGVLDTADIINVADVYNAQATIRVQWSDDGDGTYDLRVFYDDVLVGATTVSDVEIVGNTCAGEFGLTDGGFGEDFIAQPILFGAQYNKLLVGA